MSSTIISNSSPHQLVKRPNPVSVGTIVWLGSEVMFFAGLFAIYFTLRSATGDHFAQSAAGLNVTLATINTTILVLSSVTCQIGAAMAENGRKNRGAASRFNVGKWGMVEWFYLTYFMGAIFITVQVFEYAVLVGEGITISSSPYGSAFYITTGFHGIHVALGLFAFLFVIGRAYAVKRLTAKEQTSAHVVSYYWHFVDVVWVALYFVIYWLK